MNTAPAEEPAWKKTLTRCGLFVGAVVGLVMLILSIIAYTQIAGFTNDFDSVTSSWQTLPVGSVSLVAGTGTCPSGAEEIKSSWPGIYPACNCEPARTAGQNDTDSDTTSCTTQNLAHGCLDRTATAGVTLTVIQGYTLCITRVSPSALGRTQNADACLSSEKRCGENDPIPFCWDAASECPVTDMLITTTDSRADPNYNAFSAVQTGTYWLYVRRGGRLSASVAGWGDTARLAQGQFVPTGLPLTTVYFMPAQPCFLSGCGYARQSEFAAMQTAFKAANPTRGYTQRPLDCTGGCTKPEGSSVSPSGRDIRFEGVLYDVSERDLYTAAGVDPGFIAPASQDSTYRWSIQDRSEIKWRSGCPQSRAQVYDRRGDVKAVRSAQAALLAFGVISFVFLSLIFPCIEVCGSAETKEKNATCMLVVKAVIKCAIIACTLATAIIAARTNSFWSSVNEANGCADPLTNETFQVLGKKFADLSTNNYITIAISIFTTVVDLALGVYGRIKAGKQ